MLRNFLPISRHSAPHLTLLYNHMSFSIPPKQSFSPFCAKSRMVIFLRSGDGLLSSFRIAFTPNIYPTTTPCNIPLAIQSLAAFTDANFWGLLRFNPAGPSISSLCPSSTGRPRSFNICSAYDLSLSLQHGGTPGFLFVSRNSRLANNSPARIKLDRVSYHFWNSEEPIKSEYKS